MKRKIFYGIIFLGFFLLPIGASAQVADFVFTIAPEEVLVSESTRFQVSSVNDSGEEVAVGETFDVFLETTSESGYFHSSESNTEETSELTMNSNWDSRNFYYHDTELGEKTITIRAQRRAGGDSFEISHTFSVVSELTEEEGEDEKESDDEDSGEDSDKSSHSSPSDLTSTSKSDKLKVDAGRERLAFVGVPVLFKVDIEEIEEEKEVDVRWSFGDGGSMRGQEVEYTYLYPGEYVVVVNGEDGKREAVSRTKVTVVKPDISMTRSTTSDNLIITNNSKTEVNIGEFIIRASSTDDFIFPRDTIILKEGSIIVDDRLMDDLPIDEEVYLLSPTEAEISRLNEGVDEMVLGVEVESRTRVEALNDIREETQRIALILREKQREQRSNLSGIGGLDNTAPGAPGKVMVENKNNEIPTPEENNIEDKEKTSTSSNVIVIPKSEGLFQKLPGWGFFKNLIN